MENNYYNCTREHTLFVQVTINRDEQVEESKTKQQEQ